MIVYVIDIVYLDGFMIVDEAKRRDAIITQIRDLKQVV